MKTLLLFAFLLQSLPVMADESLIFEVNSKRCLNAFTQNETSKELRLFLIKDQTEAFEVARFCPQQSTLENLSFIKQLPAVTQLRFFPSEECPCDAKVIALLNERPAVNILRLDGFFISPTHHSFSHVDWKAISKSDHVEKLGLSMRGNLLLAGSKFEECNGPKLNGLILDIAPTTVVDDECLKVFAACSWLKSLEINSSRNDSETALELLKRCTTVMPKDCKIQLSLR